MNIERSAWRLRNKYFSGIFWIFGFFSLLRALNAQKSTVSIVCYRRMGQGMGQRLTHTLAHTVLRSKSKKNHRFLIENGGFLVAEAGLELFSIGIWFPTVSIVWLQGPFETPNKP